MERTKIDEKEIIKIQELIAPLIGKPAWRAFSGVDNWFTINFGEMDIQDGRVHSEWSIGFEYVPWEIHYKEEIHVTSADSRLSILERIGLLEGATLLDVEFLLHKSKIILQFDEEISIHINHSEIPSSLLPELIGWGIFMPGRNYISFGPGYVWALEEYRRWFNKFSYPPE